MKRLWLTLPALLLAAACIDLDLPPKPPPPGPGTLQGQLVYAVPGRATYKPAGNARVQLVNSSLQTTANAETGQFVLENITQTTGQVLITLDFDNDGAVDRQKLISLDSVKAGPGRDVSLGQVVLGSNAAVSGKVVRGDQPNPGGHAGTTVFVSNAPYATVTADDGTFLLENVPEGVLRLSFFRDGYALENSEVTLLAGQESRISAITLTLDAGQDATLSGVVKLTTSQAPAAGARVHAASRGTEVTTTTDSAGRFSFSKLRPGVYQLAVELADFKSLKLPNIAVGSGSENDVGEVLLAAGPSVPINLDGGYLELGGDGGSDGGLSTVNAVIDNPILELAPDTLGVLQAQRSVGIRPLVFHWRVVGDGGTPLTFSNNDSALGITTQFVAPSTPQVISVALTVTDALGTTSAPAFAVVRVGRKPTVVVVPSGVIDVTSGQVANVNAGGSDGHDGQAPFYEWTQLTGIVVPSISMAVTPTLSFVAPPVNVPTAMTVQLVVTNQEGIRSDPLEISFVVHPAGDWYVTLLPSNPVFQDTPDASVVKGLDAVVQNAPPDASFSFAWSPLRDSCDGGPSCLPFALALSLDAGGTQDHVALALPHPLDAQWTQTFTVSATQVGTATTRVATTTVSVVNPNPLDCRNVQVTTLSVQVICNRVMSDAGTITVTDRSAAVPGTLAYNTVDGVLFYQFDQPQQPSATLHVVIDKMTDLSGIAAPPTTVDLSPFRAAGVHYRTTNESDAEPNPGWALVTPALGQKPVPQLLGHLNTGGNRSVWSVTPPMSGCKTNPCDLPDQSFMSIPGLGEGPTNHGTTVLNVADRTYVAASYSMPTSIMEWKPDAGAWSELFVGTAPALATTIGAGTSSLALLVPRLPGPGIDEWSFSGTAFSTVGPIETATTFGNSAQFFAPSPSQSLAYLIDQNNFVQRFAKGAASWGPSPLATPLPGIDVRAVVYDSAANLLNLTFTVNAAGDLHAQGHDTTNGDYTTLPSNPLLIGLTPGNFDVARWGNLVLITYSTSGVIHVGAYDRDLHSVSLMTTDGTTYEWNSASAGTFSASFPRFSVLGGDIWLSWQELNSSTSRWRMAGRSLY